WHDPLDEIKLERRLLADSLEKARIYYLAQQTDLGNFVYSQDVFKNESSNDDNQVRQAGALWGLACLNRDRPTPVTARAVIRGLQFFIDNSRPLGFGRIGPVYPGEDEIKTGTVALITLSFVELWRGEEAYLTRMGRGLCAAWLDNYLSYLSGMEMDNGSWGRAYWISRNEREPASSPYYDGEALLAYCRAARYGDHGDLIPKIEKIAPLLAQRYTVEAWRINPDSEDTKGFFQWGCMAFLEYVEAGWKDADVMGDACLALAWWQIHRRNVEAREANTAYAVEGLLAAYRVAEIRQDKEAMALIRSTVERMLVQQISTQVGGPLEKLNFLLSTRPYRPECVGGIMYAPWIGQIRIDVVQHQVHAMLMALQYLYPN
ncbi:MAG: hypothetical protein RBU25_19300, partial [Lentisphaeria bacterium]|nr:hypothetical protein [Lentisphaeria bacterium]